MKYISIVLSLLFLLSNTNITAQKSQKLEKKLKKNLTKIAVENEIDSVSYALGVLMQENFTKQFGKLSLSAMAKGMMDAEANSETVLIKPEDGNSMIEAYVRKKESVKYESKIAANKAFLKENREKEGVLETQSGIQYEIITEGTGASPNPTDNVVCHYHGTLIDGTVFDSSIDRGEPATFPLNRVIRGWTEILQMMKVGSIWKVYIPSDLAYGSQGGQGMEPHSLLIFEIELISIKE